MRQPSTASAPAPSATETVARPDIGLARGVWEAPAWWFWTVLVLVIVGATLYLLWRLGLLRLRREGPRR